MTTSQAAAPSTVRRARHWIEKAHIGTWRSKDPLPLLLVLLTFTTGLVDAVSYLGLGRVFTANMTGNVVLLGFALAGTKGLSVSASGLALGAFLIGAAGGGRLGAWLDGGPRHKWLLAFAVAETVLVSAAALSARGLGLQASVAARAPVIVLTAVAMGMRNATVRRLAVPDLTTTVLTLTLTALAADSWFAGGANPRPVRRVAAVAAMLAGAFFGAVLVLHHGLAIPLVLASTITIVVAALYALYSVGQNPVERTR
jgi:uncharacterized membrane protein YoaK (UPF0700 family)